MVMNTLAQRHDLTFARRQGKSLVAEFSLGDARVILVKPQTFMNSSGEAVAELVRFFSLPLECLLIVFDDLDLPIGVLRARSGGGSGGQKGMKSIITHLHNYDIPRVRVGIDRPPDKVDAAAYVLNSFSVEQTRVIDKTLARVADAVETFVREGIDPLMDKFNS